MHLLESFTAPLARVRSTVIQSRDMWRLGRYCLVCVTMAQAHIAMRGAAPLRFHWRARGVCSQERANQDDLVVLNEGKGGFGLRRSVILSATTMAAYA